MQTLQTLQAETRVALYSFPERSTTVDEGRWSMLLKNIVFRRFLETGLEIPNSPRGNAPYLFLYYIVHLKILAELNEKSLAYFVECARSTRKIIYVANLIYIRSREGRILKQRQQKMKHAKKIHIKNKL